MKLIESYAKAWSFYVVPRFLKVTANYGLRGLRIEIIGERGIGTKFENQHSVKKFEPPPSDAVRWVTSCNFQNT